MVFHPNEYRNKDGIGMPADDIALNTTDPNTLVALMKGIAAKLGLGTTSTLANSVGQGSTTPGQTGPLVQGAVTTAAPTYSTGTTDPLSLETDGDLRTHDTAATTLLTTMNSTLNTLNLSTDGLEASLGIINETAPVTDTGSSGLNGRLQRIAQNLTAQSALISAQSVLIAAGSNAAVAAYLGTRFDDLSSQNSDIADANAIALDQLHLDLLAARPIAPSSTLTLPSAAGTTNAVAGVIGLCRMFNVQGYNNAATLRFLKLYDLARPPVVGTDKPDKTLPLPPQTGFAFDWVNPYLFTNGLAYALTTGAADSDTGALTSADVVALNIDYA